MNSVKVEVFSSPGCTKCTYAREALKKISEEFAPGAVEWREVNIMREMDYAVELGVLTTPALALNGSLVGAGLPSQKELRALLENAIGEKAAG